MGRFEELGTALDLFFGKILNRNFSKADELIQKAEQELSTHKSSNLAHDADAIIYEGDVIGATTAKQAINKLKSDFNKVVASAGDGTKDTELILARGNEQTLGDRLDATDSQLAQTEQQIENIEVLVSKFKRYENDIDDVPRILRALDYANQNGLSTIYLDEESYIISTNNITVPYSNIFLKGRNDYTKLNVDKGLTGIVFEQKENVGIDKVSLHSTNESQVLNPINAIAIMFKLCKNVLIGSVYTYNFNVGLYIRDCDNVKAKYIYAQDMVLNAGEVTGYGCNVEGSKNVFIETIESYNCERHTLYAATSDINRRPDNIRVLKIIAVWDKDTNTPSAHQAAFKTFDSDNIVIDDIFCVGLKYALWVSGAIKHTKVGSITARNTIGAPVFCYGSNDEVIADLIEIGSLDVENLTRIAPPVVIVNYLKLNTLKVDLINAVNFDTVINATNITDINIDTIKAINCAKVIYSQLTQRVYNIKKMIIDQVDTVEQNYAITNKTISNGVLDIGVDGFIHVSDTGQVTDIKGGYTGMILHIYFNSGGYTTLINSDNLRLLKARNTSYARLNHATFFKNRGVWWEITNNVADYGSTAGRPTTSKNGSYYFDQNINKPLWWNGTNWVDATGTTV